MKFLGCCFLLIISLLIVEMIAGIRAGRVPWVSVSVCFLVLAGHLIFHFKMRKE